MSLDTLDILTLWPPFGAIGAVVTPPADLPISTIGGLILRCRETDAIADEVGQRVYRRVPSGSTTLPYVVVTEVGERFVNVSGPAGQYTAEGSYQFAIMAAGATPDETAERIAQLIRRAFSQIAMEVAPIELRHGMITGTWPAMKAWVPGVQPDKGGPVVVRLVQTINTFSCGSHEPE